MGATWYDDEKGVEMGGMDQIHNQSKLGVLLE